MEESQDYYGAPSQTQNNNLTIGDRLRELYNPGEFVVVKNIDTKPLTYQFASPDSVETFSSHPGHKDTVMHTPPKRFTLQPGEQKLCPAHEADMVITNLIKQIAMTKVLTQVRDGQIKDGQSVSWDEPGTREDLIQQIYLGKQDIIGLYGDSQAQTKTQAENDLNIEEPQNAGRARKAA